MTNKNKNSSRSDRKKSSTHAGEQGIALITALMMMLLLSAITITVLAVVQSESHIAGADLKRTQTFYCAASGIEKMTSDFSALYQRTSRPTPSQLSSIALAYPSELVAEGFAFDTPPQTIVQDTDALAIMRTTQNIADPALPRVTMPNDSPFGGLIASINPYVLTSTCTARDGTQVGLTRNMNNYLIPLFQFGMFSDDDIEIHPGQTFTFNGRVHANGNIYVAGLVKFLDKVTSAHEILYDTMRNGADRGSGSTVSMAVGTTALNVPLTKGSLDGGPYISGQTTGMPNYFPGAPTGTVWPLATFVWKTTSVQKPTAPAGSALNENKFDGQLLTRVTGAAKLELPMQLDGSPTREIIKRRLPADSQPSPAPASALAESRYHTKAKIRILIDDEGVTNDVAGLYGPQNADDAGHAHDGVTLSAFDPIALGGGKALWKILDNNTNLATSYDDTVSSTTYYPVQMQIDGTTVQADTVRGVKAQSDKAVPRTITNADNNLLQDIKITTSGNHGYATGDQVLIQGVVGQTRANGTWTITVTASNKFTLDGRKGAGVLFNYTSGGVIHVVNALPRSASGAVIPAGAGITGHILIQIVDKDGRWFDVTREILSMGMTEGEPNAIVQLQRPLWAAFTQGDHDASTNTVFPNAAVAGNGDLSYANTLTDIINRTHLGADGEINDGTVVQNADGYLTNIKEDTTGRTRADYFTPLNIGSFSSSMWNSVVPINLYNVREGRLSTSNASPNLSSDANKVYERGITNVVEINMKNLARWVDGVYDKNLLDSTDAVSTNIAKPDGYVVYVSDRRGDNVKSIFLRNPATGLPSTTASLATNGMVDNVDIYGPNNSMDTGEDVQGTGYTGTFTVGTTGGTNIKDTSELPNPDATWEPSASAPNDVSYGGNASTLGERTRRAMAVAAWSNPNGIFRQSVRLFNAELLQTIGAPRASLATTMGITISTENMFYTWGNYNTNGINQAPATGLSSLNDKAATSHYMPVKDTLAGTIDLQVPSSLVGDAWFPLSKTWFDGMSSMYPDDLDQREADRVFSGTVAASDTTAVRAGIIAGNNLGAMAGLPDAGNNSGASESRLNGGIHNFPRFLEKWPQYFNLVGALIPLYRSTQAVGPYNASSSIYTAPIRNWAFDITFTDPARLPPGTPQFQHIEPTGFRQIL